MTKAYRLLVYVTAESFRGADTTPRKGTGAKSHAQCSIDKHNVYGFVTQCRTDMQHRRKLRPVHPSRRHRMPGMRGPLKTRRHEFSIA